ncbi:FadR/GntR family transcriptional regulator [Teichococcus vastitatis]|uniref:FadR family transcriptional regulator n=1 Tax=Teichococcus vastitatis TaxID=2307076 RepID=A0ABS9W845_9PROT|nr:FadR/GntR family transcriptional regulator [Pseudoroseomonas vastitatis]MCI0755417.1 FadR family transcriptional regulator [Pseudoroseomonas vastitatis]
MIHPNRHRPLSDVVHERLRDMLTSGEFPQGARLPGEHALAERLAVSRPVLRQALARLQAEGRVESRKGSGTVVRNIGPPPLSLSYGALSSIPDVRSFLEFRCGLESEMAARAAACRDPSARAALRHAAGALEAEASAGRPAVEEDIAFHLAIARASGNRFFVATLAALSEQTRFSIRLTRELCTLASAERLAEMQAEHDRILAAIEAGDVAAAHAAMAAHLQGGIRRLFGQTD